MIIFDCDDVLLDWCGGFRSWFNETRGASIKGEPGSWDMSAWLGVPKESVRPLIVEFNASNSFNWLKPMPGAVQAVRRLGEKHKLCVLTACSEDPQVQAMRRFNLFMVFGAGAFADVFCLPLGGSKEQHLDALFTLHGPCAWVEDNVTHARVGKEIGHTSYVLRRPHNRDLEDADDGLFWIDSLSLFTG